MSKPKASSILYRLIEAGQLTRRALSRPLGEHGLEPGDDAVLLALRDEDATEESHLAAAFGLEPPALAGHISRLIGRNLLTRGGTRLALTEEGRRVSRLLVENWTEVEAALLGELKRKERKALRKTLGRFAGLLRF